MQMIITIVSEPLCAVARCTGFVEVHRLGKYHISGSIHWILISNLYFPALIVFDEGNELST